MYTYNPYFTTRHNEQQFEIDPMEYVPVPVDHQHYGRKFYELWGMPEHVAREISSNAKWKQIKEYRNMLLAETDWLISRSIDTNLPLSQEWKNYRQALRDITLQTDPDNIIWPIKPE